MEIVFKLIELFFKGVAWYLFGYGCGLLFVAAILFGFLMLPLFLVLLL